MTSARSPSRPRAVIAGGSLSGLFAATTLLAAGWDVALFERSPGALDSRGGGIVLQPDVLAAFRFAGIPHGDALGVRSGAASTWAPTTRLLHRTYMPQTQTSWNMLYAAMRNALPAGVVHAGERLAGFESAGHQVTALFEADHMLLQYRVPGEDSASPKNLLWLASRAPASPAARHAPRYGDAHTPFHPGGPPLATPRNPVFLHPPRRSLDAPGLFR
ncbi:MULTISPECIES: hypothetical protein [unclassified Variovorax]|uniref:hypothetical protein n=1 Tax=unclassified Variovorax TaxID=663243 RepID=UPI0011604670|nr:MULTISPECIES: hypothetical protein [unclassified Variovorax]